MSSNNYYTSFFFFVYTYTQSRLAHLSLSLVRFSLIYHCRKRAVVTIEYLLSYLTTILQARQRKETNITRPMFYYIVCPSTAKRIRCLQREKLVAQLESSFVCHRM